MDSEDRAILAGIATIALAVLALAFIIGHFTSKDAEAKRNDTVSAVEECVELEDATAQLACVYEALD